MNIIIGIILIALMIYRIVNRNKKNDFSIQLKDSEIYIMEVVGCNYIAAKLIRQALNAHTIPSAITINKIDANQYSFYDEANFEGYFQINHKFEVIKLVYHGVELIKYDITPYN